MDYEAIIAFSKEIEQFKTCERTCRTTAGHRVESDAEHSWHLAMFLILLENELQGIDFPKLLKMALIHDLPEIYSGDVNPYRDSVVGKEEKEKKAARKLFDQLPDKVGGNLNVLFNEYLAQESMEAKIVKSADKLMPLIQNLCTNENHSSYRQLKVKYEEVVDYMDQFFSGGLLEDYYRRLLTEAHDGGVFFDSDQDD